MRRSTGGIQPFNKVVRRPPEFSEIGHTHAVVFSLAVSDHLVVVVVVAGHVAGVVFRRGGGGTLVDGTVNKQTGLLYIREWSPDGPHPLNSSPILTYPFKDATSDAYQVVLTYFGR